MVQDKLNEHLKSIESKLGSSEEVPAGVDKLDWHLTKIESLAGGGGAVKDVKVNGASVIEDKVADIKLKTINNEPVLGDGNISVVTMADVNVAIEAAIIDAINMEY